MHVVISKFKVANGLSVEVRDAFINRPHKVESACGFIRMEVMQPEGNSTEFWLITYWQDKATWNDWYRGHAYKGSHSGIPKGLKLDPSMTEIRHFEHFAS